MSAFLQPFPLIDSRNADECQSRLSGLYGDIQLTPLAQGRFHACINYRALKHIALSYGRFGTLIQVGLAPAAVYAQGFPIRGSGQHRTTQGEELVTSPERGGIVSPGLGVTLNYTSDFEHLILLIKPAALAQKLGALNGSSPNSAPRFDLAADYQRSENQALRRLVFFLANELSVANSPMPDVVLAELEQAVIVAFLSSNSSSSNHLLKGKPQAPAPWQVRRAEEYIEANWDQPIAIEALAIVTNASVRSLFHAFKVTRGYSPMAFVKQVRLRRARRMLEDVNSPSSVTEVAFACGFGNLGHFARDFAQCFGERPSEILRRTRGKSSTETPYDEATANAAVSRSARAESRQQLSPPAGVRASS